MATGIDGLLVDESGEAIDINKISK